MILIAEQIIKDSIMKPEMCKLSSTRLLKNIPAGELKDFLTLMYRPKVTKGNAVYSKVVASIVNAVFTEEKPVFWMSKKILEDLIKGDKNVGRNTLNGKAWKAIYHKLFSNKDPEGSAILKMISNGKEQRKPSVVEISSKGIIEALTKQNPKIDISEIKERVMLEWQDLPGMYCEELNTLTENESHEKTHEKTQDETHEKSLERERETDNSPNSPKENEGFGKDVFIKKSDKFLPEDLGLDFSEDYLLLEDTPKPSGSQDIYVPEDKTIDIPEKTIVNSIPEVLVKEIPTISIPEVPVKSLPSATQHLPEDALINHLNSPVAQNKEVALAIPSIDQIRRAWEASVIPSGSFPSQQDRLPFLRDLMATLRSYGYSEVDLPRNFDERCTSHWWARAKKKDQRESMRTRSLEDYDRALADLSDPVILVEAKDVPKRMSNKPKASIPNTKESIAKAKAESAARSIEILENVMDMFFDDAEEQCRAYDRMMAQEGNEEV